MELILLKKGLLIECMPGISLSVPIGEQDKVEIKTIWKSKRTARMHALFNSRYLKLFTGDVQRRLRRFKPDAKDHHPEPIGGSSAEPFTLAPNECLGMNLTEGNLFPDEEENHKKLTNEPLNEGD